MADNPDISLATGATARLGMVLCDLDNIIGMAQLLCEAIAHGAPVGALELTSASSSIKRAADCLDFNFSLWLRVADNDFPASRQQTLKGMIDAIRQHAATAMQAAKDAGPETPVDVESIVALMRAMLALAKHLRAALTTTTPTPKEESP